MFNKSCFSKHNNFLSVITSTSEGGLFCKVLFNSRHLRRITQINILHYNILISLFNFILGHSMVNFIKKKPSTFSNIFKKPFIVVRRSRNSSRLTGLTYFILFLSCIGLFKIIFMYRLVCII